MKRIITLLGVMLAAFLLVFFPMLFVVSIVNDWFWALKLLMFAIVFSEWIFLCIMTDLEVNILEEE